MKYAKRALALLLILCMTAGLLSGCANNSSRFKTEDVIAQLSGGAVTRDAVVATVDGEPITAEELLYWAFYDCDYLAEYYYESAESMDWDGTFRTTDEGEAQTLQEYILADALNTATLYRLVNTHAAADKINLTSEEKAEIQKKLVDDAIEERGGEEKFLQYLSQIGLSFDAYYKQNSTQYFYKHYLSTLPKEEVDAKVAEASTYRTKHILISTRDENDQPLSEADKAFAKARAEDLLKQLREAEDPVALFDDLMFANSADPGLTSNPDGYVATPGKMVEPYEKASLALKENEISDVVESDFGYHIILRLALSEEDTQDVRSELFADTLDEWMDAAVTETTEAYDAIDLSKIYPAMLELRAAQEEAADPEETDDAQATSSPEPTETADSDEK